MTVSVALVLMPLACAVIFAVFVLLTVNVFTVNVLLVCRIDRDAAYGWLGHALVAA